MNQAVISSPAYYGVEKLDPVTGMEVMRTIFPTGEADEYNLCLFSTSGIHGSYCTIEEVADSLGTDEPLRLTVLIFHPRTVFMYYGEIEIKAEDVPFLQRIRETSKAILGAKD